MVATHKSVCHPASDQTTAEVERQIARRVIRRLAGRPDFVGGALALCTAEQRIDEDILAGYLGCSARQLVQLALSHSPTSGTSGFDAAIQRLATATGTDGGRLALLLEQAGRCRDRTTAA